MLTKSATLAQLTVSRIGLGCMGMSEFYGAADMYGRGENERLLGRFLSGRRNRCVLATKGGIVRGATPKDQRRDTRPQYIRAACEASLRRLGLETIDLYYLHRLDNVTPVEESVGELALPAASVLPLFRWRLQPARASSGRPLPTTTIIFVYWVLIRSITPPTW